MRLIRVAVRGLKNKVRIMTVNPVRAFEAFRSCVEFYPKLVATIAFGTMAAAARMIPTSGATIDEERQTKGREFVSPANFSSVRTRPTARQSRPRKQVTAHKTSRKSRKRATGRRNAA